MKNCRVIPFLTASCLISLASYPCLASTLAIWTFGESSSQYTMQVESTLFIDTPVISMTGGDIDSNGKDGVDYTDASGVFHAAGQGAAWDDINKSGSDNDAALTIQLNTTGFTLQSIRWDYRGELATSFDMDYRLTPDGDWIEISNNEPLTADYEWHSVLVDLTSFAAINNQSFVQIRIDDLDEGDGNDKYVFDNMEIIGVPEPASLLLLGLGSAALTRIRRKK